MAFNDWHDGVNFTALTSTSPTFYVMGGRYAMGMQGTFGSVTLQVMMPDDTTFIPAAAAVVANGVAIVDLPPGSYQLLVSGANVQGFVVRVPYRAA